MSDEGSEVKRVENRIAPRFEIRVPVEYQYDAATGRGTTANVSTSGVRIAMTARSPQLSVGSGLTLRFSFFAGSFDTPFAANVVRHTDDGFAVQFDTLDGQQRNLLRQALPVRDDR